MINGVIFDFNGTMIFDKDFHDTAWRKFLENRIDRHISDEEFHNHVYGRSASDILSYFLQKNITGQESILIEEEKERIYREICLKSDKFHLAEGLPEFLDDLQKRQIPVTIATASAQKNMLFFFEHLGLARWFSLDGVVYNDGTFAGKPAPDIFWKASDLIGVSIGECAIFEDAKSGIASAKNAGAGYIVGVSSMLDEKTLLSLGADTVIPNYQNINSIKEFNYDKE